MSPREFFWSHYLELAESLVLTNDEAAFRSSISRAYYAVFHSAKKKLGSKLPISTNAHQILINELINSPLINHQTAGSMLDALREKRNSADYDIKAKCSKGDAKIALEEARAILEYLKEENDEYELY